MDLVGGVKGYIKDSNGSGSFTNFTESIKKDLETPDNEKENEKRKEDDPHPLIFMACKEWIA